MKTLLYMVMTLVMALPCFAADQADVLKDRKVYDCMYHAGLPYGVSAWAAAKELRQQLGGESRFVEYNSQAAQELSNDATADRGTGRQEGVNPRQTTFYQAYNDRGWYIYIVAHEPLIEDMLSAAINPDPRTPARQEGYEVFFTPGLYGVPYYQIFTRTIAGTVDHYDWAMPSADYRSLKNHAKVESLPIEGGVGTFIFIPWEAIYEAAPLGERYYRFNIVRWMPFAKAGGVSWNGKVHDTGNFGVVKFHPPTEAQKLAIQRRLVQYAWFKYQATSKNLQTHWTDSHMGDAAFFTQAVEPAMKEISNWPGADQPASQWRDETIRQVWPGIKKWMEFDYVVSSLRHDYLFNKRMAQSQ